MIVTLLMDNFHLFELEIAELIENFRWIRNNTAPNPYNAKLF